LRSTTNTQCGQLALAKMHSTGVYLMNSAGPIRPAILPTSNITIRLVKETVIAEPNGTLVARSVVIELGPCGGLLDGTLMQRVRREEG
jgi:phospholipid N-methyltransferase